MEFLKQRLMLLKTCGLFFISCREGRGHACPQDRIPIPEEGGVS